MWEFPAKNIGGNIDQVTSIDFSPLPNPSPLRRAERLPKNLKKSPKPSQNPAQNPRQTLQNRTKIDARSLQGPFGRALQIKAPKKDAKKWPKRRQEPPNPSQNPPKILPKPSQNQSKNTIEKTSFLELFFSRFFYFFTSRSIDFSYDFVYVSNPKFTSKSMPVLVYFRRLFSSSAKNAIL